MLALLVHWYNYAEIYAVMLFPVVVILGIWTFYALLRDHSEVFVVVGDLDWEEESSHG